MMKHLLKTSLMIMAIMASASLSYAAQGGGRSSSPHFRTAAEAREFIDILNLAYPGPSRAAAKAWLNGKGYPYSSKKMEEKNTFVKLHRNFKKGAITLDDVLRGLDVQGAPQPQRQSRRPRSRPQTPPRSRSQTPPRSRPQTPPINADAAFRTSGRENIVEVMSDRSLPIPVPAPRDLPSAPPVLLRLENSREINGVKIDYVVLPSDKNVGLPEDRRYGEVTRILVRNTPEFRTLIEGLLKKVHGSPMSASGYPENGRANKFNTGLARGIRF